MKSKIHPRTPGPRDVELGQRVRMRRLELGMSQGALAAKLGVSFQQVQKYERGANHISVPRLEQIAGHLKVAAASFLGQPAGELADSFLASALAERGVVELVRAFVAIRDEDLRAAVLELARKLARSAPARGRERRLQAAA